MKLRPFRDHQRRLCRWRTRCCPIVAPRAERLHWNLLWEKPRWGTSAESGTRTLVGTEQATGSCHSRYTRSSIGVLLLVQLHTSGMVLPCVDASLLGSTSWALSRLTWHLWHVNRRWWARLRANRSWWAGGPTGNGAITRSSNRLEQISGREDMELSATRNWSLLCSSKSLATGAALIRMDSCPLRHIQCSRELSTDKMPRAQTYPLWNYSHITGFYWCFC
jgi:hypothetical protein